jgi:hypothetical protein
MSSPNGVFMSPSIINVPMNATAPVSVFVSPIVAGGDYVVTLLGRATRVINGSPVTEEQTFPLRLRVIGNMSISYPGSPFCVFGPLGVVQTTGITPGGGSFSSTPGLSINNFDGTIQTLSSVPGIYTVTYISFSGGAPATTSVEIKASVAPVLADNVVCGNSSVAENTLGLASFSWTNDNTSIGLQPSGNNVIPSFQASNNTPVDQIAHITVTTFGNCGPVNSLFKIIVHPASSAQIIYSAPMFCNSGFANVIQTGTTGGTYSAGPGAGLSINPVTGTVDLGQSAPGNYNVIYSGTGICGVYSVRAPFIVSAGSVQPVILSASTQQAVCSGSNVLLTQTGGSLTPGASWQWYKDANFTQTVGALIPSGNALITVAPQQTTTYYLRAIGGICPAAAGQPIPASVTVTILQMTASIAAVNPVLCGGGSTTIKISNGPANGFAKVLSSATNTSQSISLDASGAGSFSTGVVSQNITYTILTVGNASCNSSVNIPVTVSVSQLSPTAMPNPVVCSGIATAPIVFQGGFPAGTQFSWTNSNTAIGLVASGTGTSLPSFVPVSNGTALDATISVTPILNIAGCQVGSTSFRIRVSQSPSVDPIHSESLCAGATSTAVSFSGNMAGTIYSWSNNNTSTGIAAAGTGFIPAQLVVNNTGGPQTSFVTVTPRNNSCNGLATQFAITVNPAVSRITYQQPSYCQAGWAYIVLNGSMGGIYTGSPAGLNIDPTSGAVNLALSVPGTYTVTYNTASQGACSGIATTQITVRPQATVNSVPNQVVCGGTITSPVVFTGTAASYTWTNDNPSIGLASAGTGNLPSFAALNAGPGAVYGTIRVTPVGNGSTSCTAKAISFRYLVNFCPPVTHAGDHSGDGNTSRISIQVSASPNPTQGRVTVQLSNKEIGSYSIQVLNSFGEPVNKAMFVSGNSISVDLSGLNPGIYRLQVMNTRTGSSVQKQVIKL